MNPGGTSGRKARGPAGGTFRSGVTRTIKRGQLSGTMSTVPYKGMTRGDIQGVKEALAIRYGRPDPAVDAVRRRQGAFRAPGNDFDSMRRRVVRTRMTNSGLTFNTDDRPARGYKRLNSGLNRARAFKTYRQQGGRPLNELTGDRLRAPYGRFSTVRNPAPARSFPSQAPGRTKAGELVAREGRKARSAKKKSGR